MCVRVLNDFAVAAAVLAVVIIIIIVGLFLFVCSLAFLLVVV